MQTRHVTHLLTRYVHGQLRPSQRARVINHVRTCPACRVALAREERVAADLRREMPAFGQARPGQLAQVWLDVWGEIGATHSPPPHTTRSTWLPGLSVVLAMLLLLAVALPLLVQSGLRAEAAPMQPRPNLAFSTASPTPGVTDEVQPANVRRVVPHATVAYAIQVGASPAPMPEATVSPEAALGGAW
jgi:anti-sigma factor RsiW